MSYRQQEVVLTEAQHNRLTAIATEDPAAKVVGAYKGTPVIRRYNGRHQRVTPLGRLAPVRDYMG